MSKTYNVAIYIRLSREDGDDMESESVTNQRDFLLDYVNKYDELHYTKEYVDDGYTGTDFNRPGFEELLEDIKTKKINTIITKDLSRLGRDHIEAGHYIERFFPEKGIRYISILDNIDTAVESPGMQMISIKLGLNDMYSKDISNKIKSIMKMKKEKGQYTGWKGIYGYMRDPGDNHKLIVDDNVRHIVVRMFELAKSGKGTRYIADTFSKEGIPTPSNYANLNRGKKSTAYDLWCPRTIDELLENPTYIGHLTQGRRKKVSYKSKKEVRVPKEEWIIVENTHEAIIDEETFNTVQEIMKKNKNNPSGKQTHLLKGFMFCKECGHSIGVIRNSSHPRKYCVCNYYTAYSKFGLCTPHSMNYDKLETAVLESIKKVCTEYVDSSNFEDKIDEAKKKKDIKIKLRNEITKIDAKIAQLTSNIDKSYIDKLNEIITLAQYNRMTIKFNEDIENFNNRRKELISELNNMDSNDSSKEKEETLKRMNEFLTFEKPTRELLVNLIDNITISEDKTVEINYKFRLI